MDSVDERILHVLPDLLILVVWARKKIVYSCAKF